MTRQFQIGLRQFYVRIKRMISQPVFLALTILGNLVILSGSGLVYKFEMGINPKIENLLDCIWWAVATVTTVGYGDITPITPSGKVVGIFLMIIGTALFWSYTALFAEALLFKEIDDLESSLQNIEKILHKTSEHQLDKEKIQKHIQHLQRRMEK